MTLAPPRRRRDPLFRVTRRPPADPLAAEAAALCRAVAPADLAGLPVYVVRMSAVPAELGGGAACGGFTSPVMDLVLRDVIGPAWRGRGPCLVADDRSPARRPGFLGTVAHELAHVLDRDHPFRPVLYASPASLRDAFSPDLSAMAAPGWHTPARAADGHGPQFFRLLVHVADRAAAVGWPLPEHWVHGYAAAFSPLAAYRAALGGEPARLAGRALRDVRATPVPPAAAALWAADAARLRASADTPGPREENP